MSSRLIKQNELVLPREVTLPASKSLSNRALMIRAFSGGDYPIHNLSESDDTTTLVRLLESDKEEKNAGPAGTNFRFLLSYYASTPGKIILTGSDRMLRRPVLPLVEALRSLGADIQSFNAEGTGPFIIDGKPLEGGSLSIPGNISSQFISSLLMAAPYMKKGLLLNIEGTRVSEPYIEMTLGLMKLFGVQAERKDSSIEVKNNHYTPFIYTVEPDWSSAAFWLGLIATTNTQHGILLKGLDDDSLQGDKKCLTYFKELGVYYEKVRDGLMIKKDGKVKPQLDFDLINEPDLFPVLAYTCGALGVRARFRGLETLNLKESDRIDAVARELRKLNIETAHSSQTFEIKHCGPLPDSIKLSVYDDHRLAMSSAVLVGVIPVVEIENPGVVSKSYPGYWQDLGF